MADDEEESMSEGFSASEDEWKPSKNMAGGGESSDDDDSDFEQVPAATSEKARKKEGKARSATKAVQGVIKKRKPAAQSLRTKLYNKYRPPPKTLHSPSSGNNSPSASTSRKASKNAQTPNEASEQPNDSSSESSVNDYLVNPAEIDLQSSFFNVPTAKEKSKSPAPVFDCNAGIQNLSDSDSEDNNESSGDERKPPANAFDFRQLLEKANSLERAKETIAKRTAEREQVTADADTAMDVNSLLALGENAHNRSNSNAMEDGAMPQRLQKTKSTRIKKRQNRTRPNSTLVVAAHGAGDDTDDSDMEEVADDESANTNTSSANDTIHLTDLEIRVELPTRQRARDRKQQDLELAFRRKLNRDLKERQLLLHKTSLLCCFARWHKFNRLINDTALWQKALQLLPSKSSYPPELGTELRYWQAFVTWFKTAIKLTNPNMYADDTKTRRQCDRSALLGVLLGQLQRKEACCKQDMVLLFVALVRGMGLQCRLVVNMQPLPLKPAQSDLLTIKLKPEAVTKAPVANVQVKTVATAKAHEQETGPKKRSSSVDSTKENNRATVKVLKVSKSEEAADVVQKSAQQKRSQFATSKEAPPQEPTRRLRNQSAVKSCIEKEKDAQESGSPCNTKPTLSKLKRSQSAESRPATSSSTTAPVKKKSKPVVEDAGKAETKIIAHAKKSTAKPDLGKLKLVHVDSQASFEVMSNQAVREALPSTSKPKETATRRKPKDAVASTAKAPPKITIKRSASQESACSSSTTVSQRITRSRSKSPKFHIAPDFLMRHDKPKEEPANKKPPEKQTKRRERPASKSPNRIAISTAFLKRAQPTAEQTSTTRVLRSRQKSDAAKVATDQNGSAGVTLHIPQLDGADDALQAKKTAKRPQLKKLQKSRSKDENSDEDFEPSPPKQPKKAPVLKDRRVLSTDDEAVDKSKVKPTAADIWPEVWCDVEQQWMCVDLFKGTVNSVESVRKSASSGFVYCYAFQNDLSLKDVTARYCPHWTTVHKQRVDRTWLETAISPYYGAFTDRDRLENQQLRRMHEQKPLPTTITEFKDHPLYALERHLLKFQAIYPPDAATCGFIRGEAIYPRDCVHTLHSRDIWLKQARTVKLGEQPYKIVKARPKWDRITQTVIKDQPLEIFGYWQTEDYVPPTAENGIVPRNAYGNVELFKACMLPKKTVHLRLPGLQRVCKKLGIDCANAVIGFDFHQGACHPLMDGFVVCEEFAETVTMAWHEEQENQDRREQEKYEARVYGNWKKLIRGLLIRERLKKKYNF